MAGLSVPVPGRSAFESFRSAEQRVPLREVRFRAMGCQCQVLILGGSEQLLELGQHRVEELDQRWSRFIATSELSRFNARAGHTSRVTPDLMLLLKLGLAGYRSTGGLFNPFLGQAVIDAGYDRDFAELSPAPTSAGDPGDAVRSRPGRPRRSPTRSPLRLDVTRRLARLQRGVVFDSGGIGKGLGADLVVLNLVASGAQGAMVSLGGDVAVGGSYPDQGWRVGVDDPFGRDDVDPLSVVLRSGSVCSSGILERRWLGPGGSAAHHIIDPGTALPLKPGGIVAVTAIAPAGWRAEIATKAALIGGEAFARRLVTRSSDCAFLLWDQSGEITQIR